MKRIAFLIPLLLCTLWQSAAAGIPGHIQGQNAFNQGDYKQALTYLLTSFQQAPDDPDVNFLLARTYFELGDFEAAVMAYERVLFSDPDSARVKLELARSYLALGAKEYARKYFQEVLATNPPEAVWDNIQRFLLSIKESERKHFITGTVSLGFDLDDNPRVAPVDDVIGGIPIIGSGASPESDTATVLTATANHIYRPPDSILLWKTSGVTYNTFYKDQSDLNVNYYEMSTGPALKFKNSLWQNTIFSSGIDVDNRQYQSSLGLSSSLTTRLLPTLILTSQLRYEDKDNKQYTFRSADNIRLTLNPVLHISPTRISLSFGVENENADSAVVSYDRFFWQIRVDSPIPYGFNIYTYFLSKDTDYDEADTFFQLKRHDDYHEIGAGLSKPLWISQSGFKTLIASLAYKYIDSDSNLELYTYRRNVFSISTTYAF